MHVHQYNRIQIISNLYKAQGRLQANVIKDETDTAFMQLNTLVVETWQACFSLNLQQE